MGLFMRARSLQTALRSSPEEGTGPARSGGLLWKSLQLLKSIQPSSPGTTESGSRSEATAGAKGQDELFSRLSQIRTGLEAPAQFFGLLKHHLNLERAALLLFDPVRLVFAPWAESGFDETTSHRLRLPLGANEAMNRLANGRIAVLRTAEELAPFQKFFSAREFSSLKSLLLAPFIHENRFMGLLLIADRADGAAPYETLCARAAPLLFTARERHLEAARRGAPGALENLHERLREAAQSCQAEGSSLTMMRFSVKKISERIRKHNRYIDTFRLREDIFRVIHSLFQSLGSVFRIDQQRVLVLVSKSTARDAKLLLYHLKGTLRELFHELSEEDQVELEEEVRSCAGGAEEAKTLFAELV